jgi:hypothetical protein
VPVAVESAPAEVPELAIPELDDVVALEVEVLGFEL